MAVTMIANVAATIATDVAECWYNSSSHWNGVGVDGIDIETGSNVEIGAGNLVRPGLDIEIFDYNTSEYRDFEVQSIRRTYGGVEVEIYDYDAREYRTLEMDD